MKYRNLLYCLCCLPLFLFSQSNQKIEGLSFVAPPKPFQTNPMQPIAAVGANWIAVIPYAYTRVGQPKVHYNSSKWQWWGERPEGYQTTIKMAHQQGLRVMLKPQVYVPGSWTGGLNFETEKDWQAWEVSYLAYILPMAKYAEAQGVELFCIGTEFKQSTTQRPQFWKQVIDKVREEYCGQLTYAANWDEYQFISFWKELDYIGIDAYFELTDKTTPSVTILKKAWKKHLSEMRTFQKQQQKPILFTEFGYLSVDKCAHRTWELEKNIKSCPINEQAQANAYEALFACFWELDWWAGGFVWKWFPEMQGHEGYITRDYTPQDKLAQKVLKKWYGGD